MRVVAARWMGIVAISVAELVAPSAALAATEWRPERNIEVIVGVPPGGPLDGTARLMQKFLEKRHFGISVAVMNKAGGSHAIAMAYLNQHAADAHYVSMALPNLLTNRIIGAHPLTYTDVTPLALLTSEYIGMSVRAESPLKTGKDLLAKMRADPGSLTFAITSRASGNHIAAGTVLKAAGIDLKKVKFVSFKGAAETTVAVLGGHVDVVMATPTSTWRHVQAGKMRMLAVTAPQRLAGEVSAVPTWKELGVNAVSANWRSVVGPKGLTPAQIAYWDQTLSAMVKSAEWQESLKSNQWEDEYLNSANTVKFMREEYKELEALLTELGDAKK
ncbi:MAG: tripartite tricarboxylate transporter substrate binding protein [Pseudomonadota bacterium]